MSISNRTRKLLETASVSIILYAVNLFFPDNPGFSTLFFLPYAASAIFLSVYYGRLYGFISFACSVLCIILLMVPALHVLYTIPYEDFQWNALVRSLAIPGPITLALIYLFGMIHKGFTGSIKTMRGRMKELTQQNSRLSRITGAQAEINRELEERVSKQQESITNLYTQIQLMNTLDHKKILQILLETVRIFTGTKKASLWCIAEQSGESLSKKATLGWTENDTGPGMIPLDGSIEGWVFRNKSLFSVRMLLQYENLAKMCTGRNILTLPITVGHQVWGVLNIEDIPFEKYNLYTEQLLTIILSLAQGALENALEYESLVRKEEKDTETGLPLFSQLYRFLEEKIKGPEATRGYLSLVVLEIMNMDRIIAKRGNEGASAVLKNVLARMENLAGPRARSFKYRNNNQFAFAFTDMDYDGIGMFCLEALGTVSEGGFVIAGTPVAVELILGYAVAGSSTTDVNELLSEAEHLLEMQKV